MLGYFLPSRHLALALILLTFVVSARQNGKDVCDFLNIVISETVCSVPTLPEKTMSRKVISSLLSIEQDEGVGARVRRSIGRPEVGH